jgi:hypothetical protein
MPQIFHRSMNTFSKATIFGGFLLIAALALGWDQFNRSSYVTEADIVRDQPIPFSHEHHVSGLGIDCRYCHTTVETSSFAGIPPTQTCMNCHSLIWKDSPLLEPVRHSARTNQGVVAAPAIVDPSGEVLTNWPRRRSFWSICIGNSRVMPAN